MDKNVRKMTKEDIGNAPPIAGNCYSSFISSYQTNKDALETMQRHWEWRWGLRVWINFPRLYLSLFWKLLSHLSRVRLCEPLWIVTCQVPLSTGFSSQALQSGLPRPPSEDLPNPWIEPESPISPAPTGRFFITSATWEVLVLFWMFLPPKQETLLRSS